MAGEGAPAWSIIWAKTQTAGRGRQGKTWQSKPGNLFMSIILWPSSDAEALHQLSFVTAIAVQKTLGFLEKKALSFKWPNDILLNGKKLAGILLETGLSPQHGVIPAPERGSLRSAYSNADRSDPRSRVGMTDTDGKRWLVIGIGMNIKDFPENTDYPATSLYEEIGDIKISLEQILEGIIKNLTSKIADWEKNGFAKMREEWLESAIGLNRPVNIKLPGGIISGTFKDLDESGNLVLDEDSTMRKISAGELFFPDMEEASAACD